MENTPTTAEAGRDAPPETHLMVTVSTAHLPPRYALDGPGAEPGVVAHRAGCGWMMWVPDDPYEFAAGVDDAVPAELVALQVWARERVGADWLHFDPDAADVAGLERYEWP